MRYAGEHRGHRLVERLAPRAGRPYRLPERYAHLSISENIRRLAAEGWDRDEISHVTDIRYQHVRNVLEDTDRFAPRETGSDNETGKVDKVPADALADVGRLEALLDRVRRGAEIMITRHGVPVARLVPAGTRPDRAAIEAALRRMDERRKSMSLKGLSLRELIDEGRP